VNEGPAARQWYIEARSWQGLHRHALMTMIAYAFLQHRRLASDVILEALAGSGASDAALQMADATIIQTLCWPRKGSRASVLGRSRGRRSTKINARTNAEGLPIGLVITPGQAHDVTAFHTRLRRKRWEPKSCGDRARKDYFICSGPSSRGCNIGMILSPAAGYAAQRAGASLPANAASHRPPRTGARSSRSSHFGYICLYNRRSKSL
jgi:hypothetical protein